MALALARRGLRRRPRGPYAFPGTNPAFDPALLPGLRPTFVSVSRDGNHFNLLSGKPGTVVGTVTPKLSIAGPGIFTAAAATAGLSFTGIVPSGNRSAFANQITLAAIFSLDGNGTGFEAFFSTDSGNGSGFALYTPGGQQVGVVSSNVGGTGAIFSSVPLNIPHLIIASNYGSTITSPAVLVNLTTGVVRTATFSGRGLAAQPGSGSYCVGNIGTASASASGTTVHTTMAVERTLHAVELAALAADPWGLWYPQ